MVALERTMGTFSAFLAIMKTASCGGGLAEHSVLPTKIAELLGSVAETLSVHTSSLDETEKNAQTERRVYRKLIDEHRHAAEILSAIGEEMASYRDLPPAKHDPKAMASPKALEAFEEVVKREREILALLEKKVENDQKVLLEMVVAAGR
jgi:hypothetical protein